MSIGLLSTESLQVRTTWLQDDSLTQAESWHWLLEGPLISLPGGPFRWASWASSWQWWASQRVRDPRAQGESQGAFYGLVLKVIHHHICIVARPYWSHRLSWLTVGEPTRAGIVGGGAFVGGTFWRPATRGQLHQGNWIDVPLWHSYYTKQEKTKWNAKKYYIFLYSFCKLNCTYRKRIISITKMPFHEKSLLENFKCINHEKHETKQY